MECPIMLSSQGVAVLEALPVPTWRRWVRRSGRLNPCAHPQLAAPPCAPNAAAILHATQVIVCLSAVLASPRPPSSVSSPSLPSPRVAFSFFCFVSLALSGAAFGRLFSLRPIRALSFSSSGGGGWFACCVAAAFFLWCFSLPPSAAASVAVSVFVGAAALPRSCPCSMRRRPCGSLAAAPLRLPRPACVLLSVCPCVGFCHFVC